MQKRLKIAHITRSLDRRRATGVGTFFQNFVHGIDPEQAESVVIACEDAPDRSKYEAVGLPVHSRLQQRPELPSHPIETTQWLIRTLQHLQPDVVQTHVSFSDNIGRLAAAHAKVPVIVCRENNIDLSISEHYRATKRRLAQVTDQVVCVSGAVQQYICQVEGIPSDITTTIHNGLPLHEYPFKQAQPTNQFVYVGRLSPQKAPLRLLEAFSIIADEYPECELTVIGGNSSDDDTLLPDCQKFVQRLGIGDHVHFLGYQPQPWQAAPPGSIFVHCCDYEGFGTTITEARAVGHLCVVPSVGGIPEGAEAGSEVIFYQGDRDSLVVAMRQALEMPIARRLQMIHNARARVERDFDARRMVAQYLDLYQTLYTQKQCL